MESVNASVERAALRLCNCERRAISDQLAPIRKTQVHDQVSKAPSNRNYLVNGQCNDYDSVAIFIAFRGVSLQNLFTQCSLAPRDLVSLVFAVNEEAKTQLEVSHRTEHCEMLRTTP